MGKVRVQVCLSDTLTKDVDEIAESMGMTRSGLCAYYIAQMVRNQKLVCNDDFMSRLAEMVSEKIEK